jgi:polyphosphate kinase 2 (PPK2 family)
MIDIRCSHFQAMDGAGKTVTKHVMSGVNPQGCR